MRCNSSGCDNLGIRKNKRAILSHPNQLRFIRARFLWCSRNSAADPDIE
jgi:hypothetical protein